MDFNVLNLNLEDVFKKYLGYTSSDFDHDNAKRTKTLCPFHQDSDPSMMIYDNRERQNGYFYTCLVCKAKGNAVDLLINKGIEESSSKAEERLRTDFGLILPLEVRVAYFSDLKGIPLATLNRLGWENTKVGFKIPYYDEKCNIIGLKTRTKYAGKDKYFWSLDYEGKDFHYGWQFLSDYSDEAVYFVEGETDMATMFAAGYPVIGIPSANAFAAHKFAHLYTRFKKKIVVRDQDAAGQNLVNDVKRAFPESTYILDINEKHKDVNDVFNFGCSRDIEKLKHLINNTPLLPSNFETAKQYIASDGETILKDLRLLNKVYTTAFNPLERSELYDAFCASSKHNKKDIKAQIEAAENMHKKRAKVDREIVGGIYESDNCYMIDEISNKGVFLGSKMLSNFVIRPKFNVNRGGEIERYVDIHNHSGYTYENIDLSATDISDNKRFNISLSGIGDCRFLGNNEHLNLLILHLFQTEVPVIYKADHVGSVTEDIWLFGNVAVSPSGEVITQGEEDFFVIDGKGYALIEPTGEDCDLDALPTFPVDTNVSDDLRRELVELMVASFGTTSTLIGLGTQVASIMYSPIQHTYGCFPITFITGKKASGKSTYATLIHSLWGYSAGRFSRSIATTTYAGMLRTLAYHKSVPVYFDDYRNDKSCIQKNEILLNAYNRQGRTRADMSNTASKHGSITDVVNSPLIISGEELPRDSAILSRGNIITLSASEGVRTPANERRLGELFEAVKPYTLTLISRLSSEAERIKFMAIYDEQLSRLNAITSDPRASKNMAAALAGLIYGYGDVVSEALYQSFYDKAEAETVEACFDADENHALAEFFNAIPDLVEQGRILPNVHYAIKLHEGKRSVAIHYKSTYQLWVDYTRGSVAGAFDRMALIRNLRKEAFVISMDSITYLSARENKKARCLLVDLEAMPSIYADFKLAFSTDDGYELRKEIVHDTEF